MEQSRQNGKSAAANDNDRDAAGGHIAVLDRHPLFRQGLCRLLDDDGLDCREIASFDDLVAHLEAGNHPGLVLFDLWSTGPADSMSQNYLRINCIRSRYPRQSTLVVSDVENPAVVDCCMALGVSGYVRKSQQAREIRAAVRTVLAGDTYVPPGHRSGEQFGDVLPLAGRLRCLTGQESRVLMMICDGMFNQEIAHGLGLTEATVKAHVSRLLRKLSVPNRTNAVVMVERLASAAV